MPRSEASRERGRVQSREAKQRRKGTCVDCGAVTSYCGGNPPTSERCLSCAKKRNGIGKRGTGPLGQRVLARLEHPARLSVLAREMGISRGHANVLLLRLMRYGLVERIAYGTYQRTSARARTSQ